MKKLLPFVFAGTLLVTACGNDDEATEKETKEPVEVVDESVEQANKTSEVTEDATDEVIDDVDFSEKMFMAEAVEEYRLYYTELNIEKLDSYFAEDSVTLEEQKQAIQSLIDQGVTLEHVYSHIESVETVGNNNYEVTANEVYRIYRDNEEETVEQTAVYHIYYGYADELLISSIEIQ